MASFMARESIHSKMGMSSGIQYLLLSLPAFLLFFFFYKRLLCWGVQKPRQHAAGRYGEDAVM